MDTRGDIFKPYSFFCQGIRHKVVPSLAKTVLQPSHRTPQTQLRPISQRKRDETIQHV